MSQYLKRDSFFAHRFCRILHKGCAAQDIGRDACYFLTVIAHTEDAARYTGPVRYWNSQLMQTMGFTSPKQLNACRSRAIDAGWLHYERQGTRSVGMYWVLIPSQFEAIDDGLIEPIHSPDGMNSGTNPGTNSGKLSNPIPIPIPSPNQCGDGVATSGNATSPPASSKRDEDFERFWGLYPARDGRKREKAKARTQWAKLSQKERQKALRAAPRYAKDEKFIKDAFRWLRDKSFDDWLEPASETSVIGTKEEIEAEGYTWLDDDEEDTRD